MPPTVRKHNNTSPPTRRPQPSEPGLPSIGDGTGTILDRIRPIGFDDSKGIKILLYGRSGSGKTTLWSSFPGPILSVTCSGGIEPGETRSIDTPANRKRIKEVVPESTSEMPALLEYLSSPQNQFRTVVLDHASGYQDMALKDVLGLREIPVAKLWGTASQQQYGQVTVMCKEVFRHLLNLKCNVVFVAAEREFGKGKASEGAEVQADDAFQPAVGAALMPELGKWLNYAVDYIGQTLIRQKTVVSEMVIGAGTAEEQRIPTVEKVPGQVEYVLRVQPHPVVVTKFRVPKGSPMPDFIPDPTYDKIMSVIRGQGLPK